MLQIYQQILLYKNIFTCFLLFFLFVNIVLCSINSNFYFVVIAGLYCNENPFHPFVVSKTNG